MWITVLNILKVYENCLPRLRCARESGAQNSIARYAKNYNTYSSSAKYADTQTTIGSP